MNNIISIEQELISFLDQILSEDQSNSEHSKAKECYGKLKSRESDFMGTTLEKKYWNTLSILLVHIAQIEAIFDENMEQSRYNFTGALEAAEKGSSNGWITYLKGTLSYLDNDPAGIIQAMEQAENNEVLQRFIRGLRKRGIPDYKEDYLSYE